VNIRAVHIDGAIFVGIAITGAAASALGSVDAAIWVAPSTLWYVKNVFTAVAAGLLSLKMFRSQAYSKDVKEQQSGVTEAGDPVVVKKKEG
jgi:hypothetical protein